MKSSVLLLILLLVTGRLLYEAGAPPVPEGDAAVALNLAGGIGVAGRLRHGVGVYGARLAEPAVHRLVEGHATDRLDLERVSRVAPRPRRDRAQGALRRIQQLDSLALARLESGNPVAAVKFAIQAGGLAEAVRDDLVEETRLR